MLIYTPEYHYYLLRRWGGKMNPRLHLFDHNGVWEFDTAVDTVAQVLWAYAMRMGVDLIHVYEATIDLFDRDPSSTSRSTEYDIIKRRMSDQIVQMRNRD